MPLLDVAHAVVPMSQSKPMSCWAAAAAMLLSWKSGVPRSELSVAQQAGSSFSSAYGSDSPLYGPDIANFAAALGLVTEPPKSYSPQGYATLLATHGPFWIGTAIFSLAHAYRHVRIVRGILGDGDVDTTKVKIVDPDGARDYQLTVREFSAEVEAIAIADLGPDGQGHLDPQVIRFP